MAAPFFDNISGTVTVAPTTGAFTPTGASVGALAWSTVPANQIVSYRADEGSTWELGLGLWNGTTLTRALLLSSSGAQISFGTGVVVSLDVPADDVSPNLGSGIWNAQIATNSSSATSIGIGITVLGTNATATVATTNYLTRQTRNSYTSGTLAGNAAGLAHGFATATRSSTAFMGGFDFSAIFGVSALPTGPRLAVGMSPASLGNVEPSTVINSANFGKDSTDTNIQLMTCAGTGTATKVDTGIPLVANAYYKAKIWCNPGEAKIYYVLIRLDTGAIFTGNTTTTLPAVDVLLAGQITGTLSGTTGTAIVMHISKLYLKSNF